MRYIHPYVVSHLFISFHVCAILIHESHSSTHSCATFACTLHCTHSSLLMYQPHRLIPPWPVFSSITYHIHGLIRSFIPPCLYHLLIIYQVKCLAPSQGDTSRMGSRHQASSHRCLLFSLVHIYSVTELIERSICAGLALQPSDDPLWCGIANAR